MAEFREVAGALVTSVHVEVAIVPFAFTLVLGGEPPDPAYEITKWLGLPADEVTEELFIGSPLGFGHTPIFGDFSTLAQYSREAGLPAPQLPSELACLDPRGELFTPAELITSSPTDVVLLLPGTWNLQQAPGVSS